MVSKVRKFITSHGMHHSRVHTVRLYVKIEHGRLFGFMSVIFGGYLMPNPFHTNKQFDFKQFSLA